MESNPELGCDPNICSIRFKYFEYTRSIFMFPMRGGSINRLYNKRIHPYHTFVDLTFQHSTCLSPVELATQLTTIVAFRKVHLYSMKETLSVSGRKTYYSTQEIYFGAKARKASTLTLYFSIMVQPYLKTYMKKLIRPTFWPYTGESYAKAQMQAMCTYYAQYHSSVILCFLKVIRF